MKRIINTTELQNLISKGYSDKEIAEILKFTRTSISRKRRGLGIFLTLEEQDILQQKYFKYYDIFQDLTLLAALCGTLLGDGCLSNSSKRSSKGTIAHCIKQREYLEYKYLLLKPIVTEEGVNKGIAKEKQRGKYIIKETEYYYISLKSSPFLKTLRDILYPDGKKQFSKELIPYLTDISIALFYFDDGYKHAQKHGLGFHYRLTNYAFSNESKQLFVEFLKEKFNIKSAIHKGYFYIADKESVLIFQNILNKYKVNCMEYKI